MITAKELRFGINNGFDSIDLYKMFSLVMADIINCAKDGCEYYRIEGEEYFHRETPESTYVLDCLEDLGYTVEIIVKCNLFGEYKYITIISWGK